MTIHAQWHKTHKMPKNPTHEQRIAWHSEHALHCSCRTMPENLQEEVELYRMNNKT